MNAVDDLRKISLDDLEVRIDEENETAKISGYAAVFNRYSVDLGGFKEILRPGCFRKVLGNGEDVVALINHNRDTVFATKNSGTLKLEENQKGLKFDIDIIPDDDDAKRVYSKVKNGLMNGCSFSFRVAEEGEKVKRGNNGEITREILEVEKLGDVSVVTSPAYPATSVNVRTAEETRDSYTASQRALDEADEIAGTQRALELRRKRLKLKEKEVI